MKKFISLILTMLIIYSTCVYGGASAELTEEQIRNNQIQANEQYQRLLKHLESQTVGTGRNVSEDYYGGAYINDHGNLVVCVTDAYPAGSSEIQTYTANNDVIVRQVEYTFAELKHEQDRINALYHAYFAALDNADSSSDTTDDSVALIVDSLCGTYISEERNVLVVTIEDLNEEKIQAFRNAFSNEEYLAFEIGYKFVATSSTQSRSSTQSNPGMAIYYPVPDANKVGCISMGYPVYYTAPWGQRTLGFITAGHVFEEGDMVYRDVACTQVIGVCERSQFSGDTDAALIRISNSNYAPSFTTEYGNSTLIGHFALAEGSFMFKEGVASQKTYGEILSSNHTVTVRGVTLTDLYATSAKSIPGDSGGVAYDAGIRVIGSVVGAGYSQQTPSLDCFVMGYICKYSNAAEALNCSISG